MASINPVQRQPQIDPLEKLANAVGIARQIYGIHADSTNLDLARQQREDQSRFSGLQSKSLENEQAGIVSGKERATLLKDLEPVQEGDPRAFILRSNNPDGSTLEEYVRSKKDAKAPDPLAQALKQTHLQEAVDRQAKEMKNDLDADRGRSGNFGQASAKVMAADRLKTLVDSYQGGDLPPAQMEELALGMANMLNNGNVAGRDQVKALVPNTWYGGSQSAAQWLMNEPRGAGQQKFVEQMAHTIDREKDLANDQLNSIRVARLPGHEGLKKSAPDVYNSLLQSYGVDPANIQNGKYVKPSPGENQSSGNNITIGGKSLKTPEEIKAAAAAVLQKKLSQVKN